MVNPIIISGEQTNHGILVRLNNNAYEIRYSEEIWSKVSSDLRETLVDNLTVATTMHLAMVMPETTEIRYKTHRPVLEPYFNQNFINDIPSCADVDGLDISDETRRFLQVGYSYDSHDIRPLPKDPVADPRKAIVGMSFGKDSLLTYAVAEEVGLNPEMVYVVEESLRYEEKHKRNLAGQFFLEFGKELHILTHDTGKLRNYDHLGLPKSEYGWGLQNTEYAMDFLPFAHALGGRLVLFGNEQSAGTTYLDKTGRWRVYPCYDQTHEWTVQLDQMTKALTAGSVGVGSLIEPLMDMMIQRMLVRRYPHYAKYQMSCFTETEAGKDYHWCHECRVCAKMYLLCCGGGVDPQAVGFRHNMLEKKHKGLFTLFGGISELTYANTGLGRDEQLFAFYLATKNGTTGGLVEEFMNTTLYQEARDRFEELVNTFLHVYTPISVPQDVLPDVLSIYNEEVTEFTNSL